MDTVRNMDEKVENKDTMNTDVCEYRLIKGEVRNSAFATFLKVLAWCAWIFGVMMVLQGSSYGSEVVLMSLLTVLVPYLVTGILLYGVASVVAQVSEIHQILTGIELRKEEGSRN